MARRFKDLGDFLLVVLFAIVACFAVVCVKVLDMVPVTNSDYIQVRRGKASWYAGGGMVCASRLYPVGSWVKVTYGRAKIVVQVTSRGPAWRFFRKGRIVDLSRTSFGWLANSRIGLIDVTVEQCDPPKAQ